MFYFYLLKKHVIIVFKKFVSQIHKITVKLTQTKLEKNNNPSKQSVFGNKVIYLSPLTVFEVTFTHGRGGRPTDSGTLVDACTPTGGA